jgi:NAD(P)-dependent dehydrogenase (short-subunit alcohol dehydrogenase family)
MPSSNRIYVVTGGFGVLGQAVADAAMAAGGRVVLIDRLATPSSLSPGPALVLDGVDLTETSEALAAFRQIEDTMGGVDALLNVAGGFVWETVEGGASAHWTDLHALNLLTALNASAAALPALRRSPAGRIVNVGSAAALTSGAGMGAYAASKAGVHRLTESLADELKGSRVTVNAVLPTIIDTPANRAAMPDADPATWVSPADLAAVILFLASEPARAVTGALVPVKGGV